LLHVNTCVVVW